MSTKWVAVKCNKNDVAKCERDQLQFCEGFGARNQLVIKKNTIVEVN